MNYKISRNLEYALMALSYMSEREKQCISAKEMVQSLHCSFHPFSRALQKMADQNLIQAKKGIGGGYILSKDLKELSLYTLMKAILPPMEIADCLSGGCELLDYCNIQTPIHYLNKKFLDFYKTLNVYEILHPAGTQSFMNKNMAGNKNFINKSYSKKLKDNSSENPL